MSLKRKLLFTFLGVMIGTVCLAVASVTVVPVVAILLMVENTVETISVSPDGAVKAFVFERDGGATTASSKHISILPAYRSRPYGTGNAMFIDWADLELSWVADDKLQVRCLQKPKLTRAKDRVRGIQIEYVGCHKDGR